MKRNLLFALLGILAVSQMACSPNGKGGANVEDGGAKGREGDFLETGDPSSPSLPVDPSFIVNSSEVQTDGCLDLSKVANKFQSFPAGTMGRIFSSDVRIISEKKITENFEALVYRGAYSFEEKSGKDLLADFVSIQQESCQKVTITYARGNTETLNIVEASPNRLSLLIEENPIDRRAYRFHLINPQTLEYTREYQSMDKCPDYDQATVKKTMTLKWGSADQVATEVETVSAHMLRKLSKAVVNVSEEISRLLRTLDVEGNETSVAVTALKALKEAAPNMSLQNCGAQRIVRPENPEDPGETDEDDDANGANGNDNDNDNGTTPVEPDPDAPTPPDPPVNP